MFRKSHALVIIFAAARQSAHNQSFFIKNIPEDFENVCSAPLEEKSRPIWFLTPTFIDESFRLAVKCGAHSSAGPNLILENSAATQHFPGALLFRDAASQKWIVQYEQNHQVHNEIVGDAATDLKPIAGDPTKLTQFNVLTRLLFAGRFAETCANALAWYENMIYTLKYTVSGKFEKSFMQSAVGTRSLVEMHEAIIVSSSAKPPARNFSVGFATKLLKSLNEEVNQLMDICAERDPQTQVSGALDSEPLSTMLEAINSLGFVLTDNKILQKF